MPHPLLRSPRSLTPVRALVAAAVLAGSAASAAGQAPRPTIAGALPRHEPLNPAVVSRSGLFVPEFVEHAEGWTFGGSVEYGSVVDRNLNWPDHYLLDAELLRAQLRARRPLGARGYVELEGGVHGATSGFADAFFEQWHSLIQWVMEERDARPRNRYGERIYLSRAGVDHTGRPRATMPTDLRASAGLAHGARAQSVLSVTLPTTPAGAQAARGVPSVNLMHAIRHPVGSRVVLEGAAGAGYTARHGRLAAVQRTLLHMGSAGAWVRLRGDHAVHAAVFYHGPPYRGTGLPELDDAEVSANFGYEWRSRGGRRWRLSLTEDTRRRDPGIDLALRLSVE